MKIEPGPGPAAIVKVDPKVDVWIAEDVEHELRLDCAAAGLPWEPRYIEIAYRVLGQRMAGQI